MGQLFENTDHFSGEKINNKKKMPQSSTKEKVQPIIDLVFQQQNNIALSRNDRLDAYRKAHCSA